MPIFYKIKLVSRNSKTGKMCRGLLRSILHTGRPKPSDINHGNPII